MYEKKYYLSSEKPFRMEVNDTNHFNNLRGVLDGRFIKEKYLENAEETQFLFNDHD